MNNRAFPVVWLALGIMLSSGGALGETIETKVRPLSRIRPGTVIAKPAPQGWTHLILFARPRLGAGDMQAASKTARDYVKMFNTAMVARVKKADGGFELDEVAIGHSMNIDGKQVVVTPDTASALGGRLGLMGGHLLAGAQEALEGVKQVARYSTMMVFDAEAIVHHDEEHVQMTVRHLVWVSKTSGQLGAAMWLLRHREETEAEKQGKYALAEKHFTVLPPQLVEDRVLHVDKSKISFGIPTKEAFALEKLPPGVQYRFTSELAKTAARDKFTPQQVQQLAVAFGKAVAEGPIKKAQAVKDEASN